MKTSITYQEVEKIAQDFVKNGAWPTVSGVQKVLGRGSFSTVQAFLEPWQKRFLQTANMRHDVPEHIVALLEQIYVQVQESVAERYEKQIEQYEEKIRLLERDLELFKEKLKKQK